jgi:lipoprotein-anchoring transpeptidase ErfK/SrfK
LKGHLKMIVRKTVRVSIAGAALLTAMAVAAPANAQSIFFDWGSNETVNDSGREIVGFDAKARQGELIVSFGDRRVYLIIGPGKALSYPIAVPREKSKWEGVTSVSQKRVNPSWTPTPEMILENPRLPPWVPGGHPMNPLGTHALYLGSSSYRIHGTDAPWTIGTAASKGCVRMYNKDVQDLYPRVPVGTKVTVTYQTYKTSPLDSDSTKGLVAELDKGRKSKSPDDVAGSAAQAAKKWRDDDDPAENQKAAKNGSEDDADKTAAVANEDKDADTKDSGTAAAQSKTISANKSLSGYSYFKKQGSEDASDATAQEPLHADDADAPKKRSSEKRNVETGSVDKSAGRAKTSEDSAANDDAKEKSQPKDRPNRKEKSEMAASKAENSEDAAAIATRALAAAERAAAAAERAAEAAERASAAAMKAAAKSEQSSAASDQKDKEPAKAAEAAPLSAWPVVRSANP